MPTQAAEIRILQKRYEVLEDTLHTLIAWMASSAVSPISPLEANKLITMLEREEVE